MAYPQRPFYCLSSVSLRIASHSSVSSESENKWVGIFPNVEASRKCMHFTKIGGSESSACTDSNHLSNSCLEFGTDSSCNSTQLGDLEIISPDEVSSHFACLPMAGDFEAHVVIACLSRVSNLFTVI